MNNNIEYYNQNAEELCTLYDGLNFEQVHHEWLEFIPQEGTVLDIGAGSGRDARYFSNLGLKVHAVEPANELLREAKKNSKNLNIDWYDDHLPCLTKLMVLKTRFDLILISAVWMHLSPQDRKLSIKNLSSILGPHALLVITLRYGEFSDGRTSYPVSRNEVIILAQNHGLRMVKETEYQDDQIGRTGIAWQTLVFKK